MGAIIAFSISLGAMVLFVAFKLFEQSRTLPSYVAMRERGDKAVITAAKRVHKHYAKFEQHVSLDKLLYYIVHHFAASLARGARRTEQYAHDITRRMSRNVNGTARATNSSFLQEVSTHKQNLDTDRVRRETSLTEN